MSPAGRKAKPPSQRQVRASVSLSPAQVAYALEVGAGSLSAGLARILDTAILNNVCALEAIKDAAQRRDQATLENTEVHVWTDDPQA